VPRSFVRFGRFATLIAGLAFAACGSGSSSPGDGGGAGTTASGGHAGTGGAAGGGHAGAGGAAGAAGGGGAGASCAAATALACSAVDGSKTLSTLSATDAAAFCDCLATYGGGYGAPLACTCSDGSPGAPGAPTSRAACLAAWLPGGCPITVAQYISCMNLTYANPCDTTALLAAASSPDCAPLTTAACQ
jgi:hypothetical protein